MSDKSNIIKIAKQFYQKKYIDSGYIAAREGDGIVITAANADLSDLKEEDLIFVNDKNIETFEGNFRAAAVILFCAIRQNKTSEAAAIVDSDSILKLSTKRRTLKPILDDLVQRCGVSVKCATKNVAAEIVTALSGLRNACFMPDAGALVRARSLEDLFTATAVLDKAAHAELAAEDKGGTQSINAVVAFIENILYRIKSSKSAEKADKQKENAAHTEVNAESEKQENVHAATEESKEQLSEENASENTSSIGEESAEANSEQVDTEYAAENSVSEGEASAKENEDPQCVECTAENGTVTKEVITEQPQNSNTEQQTEDSPAQNEVQADVHGDEEKSESGKCSACKCFGVTDISLFETETAVIAHPYYVSAISAIGKPFDVPEKFVNTLGAQIPCVALALPTQKSIAAKVKEAIGDAPACILAQHGIVVRGGDMDAVKSICHTLENACKEYLK